MAAGAQTLATGDSRTVTEPAFPAVCTTLTAQLQIVNGAPSSETAEDTTRIQSALTGCASGKAVELAGSGSNWAYLIGPINIPSGVSLIVDGGVTVFASRVAADYQVSGVSETCGSYGSSGNACKNIISVANSSSNTGSGLYGYGVIDGRGTSTLLTVNGGTVTDTGISWYKNADTGKAAGYTQDNPILLYAKSSKSFTLYKITLRNSPMFHVKWQGTSTGGFTAWGVKIEAPFTGHNTDGIDPGGQNITVTNASISDGDDNVAVSASSAAANITVSNTTTYSGHGISIGSGTAGGLTNMLVSNVNQAGTASDPNAIALRIKSYAGDGGTVNTVTYQNVCIRDTKLTLDLDPFYDSSSSTSEIPYFENIVFQNVHVLTPTSSSLAYSAKFEGHDANTISGIWLDNVTFDSALTQSNVATEYAAFHLSGNVYPAFLQSLTGTGVSYSGTATATDTGTPACTPSTVFPYMTGELFAQTPSATNLQTASVAAGTAVTLNAIVQPAMAQAAFSGTAGSWSGAPALTQEVNFYEGTTLVGSAALAANGANDTLASLTLSNITAGTHTYTAQYPGDTNYAALTFGSVTVTVAGPSAATTTSLAVTGGATYGATQTLTATVSSTVAGTPTGTVTFYDGTTQIGAAQALTPAGTASVQAMLGAGAHSLTAVYSGDSTYVGSTSAVYSEQIAQGTATVALASPSTSPITYGTAVNLSAQVASTGGGTPTGTVAFADSGTSIGQTGTLSGGTASGGSITLAGGNHVLTANYSGDANFAAAASSSFALVVQRATPSITISPNPTSVVSGGSVTFTATVNGIGGLAIPTGSVALTSGSATLGTIQLTNGTGSAAVTLSSVGTQTITATYSGDTNYTGTSGTASVTVTAAPSTTTLALSPTSVYTGGAVQLSATVNTGSVPLPGVPVTFSQGSTSAGSAITNASGVATLSVSAPATAGAYSYTAAAAASGNYAASTSAPQTLTVVAPFTVSATPNPISISAGSTGLVSIWVTPAGGFAGSLTASCSSTASYVTCTPPAGSVVVNGPGATTSSLAITVAATTGMDHRAPALEWASACLLALFAWRSRRRTPRLLVMLLALAAAAGISGCGGGVATTSSRPSGQQTVVYTLIGNGTTVNTSITVNIQ